MMPKQTPQRKDDAEDRAAADRERDDARDAPETTTPEPLTFDQLHGLAPGFSSTATTTVPEVPDVPDVPAFLMPPTSLMTP